MASTKRLVRNTIIIAIYEALIFYGGTRLGFSGGLLFTGGLTAVIYLMLQLRVHGEPSETGMTTFKVKLDENEWRILQACKDSYPNGITTPEIMTGTKLDDRTVQIGISILESNDLIEIMDAGPNGLAAVRITGNGQLALRNR